MRVTHAVDRVPRRVNSVGGPIAVVQPDEIACGEVRGEAAVEHVSSLAVGSREDRPFVEHHVRHPGTVRADSGGYRPAAPGGSDTGNSVDRGDAHLWLPVETLEATADDDTAAVRRCDQGLHLLVVGSGSPGEEGACATREGGKPEACGASDVGEDATDVDRGVRHRKRPHLGGNRGPEGLVENTCRGVEGCDPASDLPVHAGEGPTDIDAGPVRRRLHDESLAVEDWGERQQLAGSQIEREDVGPRDLGGATGRCPGRAGLGEAAHGVRRVPDDSDLPDNAVDLGSGESVRADRLRRRQKIRLSARRWGWTCREAGDHQGSGHDGREPPSQGRPCPRTRRPRDSTHGNSVHYQGRHKRCPLLQDFPLVDC